MWLTRGGGSAVWLILLLLVLVLALARFPTPGRLRYGILATVCAVVVINPLVIIGGGSMRSWAICAAVAMVPTSGAIFGLVMPHAPPPKLQAGPRKGQGQPPAFPSDSRLPASLGAPGIGVAGFVLSLLGVSLVGIVLSWVGYAQAKREGRRSGLCLAGIIVGFAWLAVSIGLYVVLFVVASGSGSLY